MKNNSSLPAHQSRPNVSILNRISALILVAAAALAPWPFATVQVTFVAMWCALLAISLFAASLQDLRSLHINLLIPPFLFIIIYIAVVWMQAISDPPFALAHPIWSMARNLLDPSLPQHVSVQPYQGWMSLGLALSLFLAFLCGFLVSIPREGARFLIWAVAFVGGFYALYALGYFLYDHAATLLSGRAEALAPLRDPFRNRNHTATYFGTCSIVWFSLVLSQLERPLTHKGISLVDAARVIIQESPARLLLGLAGFLLCLTATFLTLSRAGLLLTLAALLICAGLFVYRTLATHPKSLLIAAVILLSGAVFVEMWGGAIAYRIGMVGLKDLERWETYRSTLGLIGDHPLLGTGLGTFGNVFPAYRTNQGETSRVWDYAHSSLLELAAEQGLPIAIGGLALACFLGVMLLRGSLQRRRDASIPLMGFGIVLLAGTHSLVDYPLQIPAYAITCGAMVGCALAQSLGQRLKMSDRRQAQA